MMSREVTDLAALLAAAFSTRITILKKDARECDRNLLVMNEHVSHHDVIENQDLQTYFLDADKDHLFDTTAVVRRVSRRLFFLPGQPCTAILLWWQSPRAARCAATSCRTLRPSRSALCAVRRSLRVAGSTAVAKRASRSKSWQSNCGLSKHVNASTWTARCLSARCPTGTQPFFTRPW